jgi:lupus La protein
VSLVHECFAHNGKPSVVGCSELTHGIFLEERRSGRSTDEAYSRPRRGNNNKKNNGYSNGNHFKRQKFDRNNVKSRYDDQEKSSDPHQIRKQVEFYFSDSNLRQDKFLFEQIGGTSNNPVDVKVIASFKRMQRFEPYSAIVAALKDSITLDVLNSDKPNDEQIQRKIPLPETVGTSHEEVRANYEHEAMKRSIYAKGFGDETSKTQVEIENFFTPFMATAVRLRRANDGLFKGSVFVEFENEEDAQQFLDLEDKPEWEGKPLKVSSKADYCREKDDLINQGKVRRNDLDQDDSPRGGYKDGRGRGGRGRGRGRGRGGNFRGRRDRDQSDSRSRSRSRSRGFHKELKRKHWRELADEEDNVREAMKPKQEYDNE